MKLEFLFADAQPQLYSDCKLLWESCFDDDAAFTDYYFSYRTAPSEVLCCLCNGDLVGMAHLLPRILTSSDAEYNLLLLAGFAVKSEYRGHKVATKMLGKITELSELRGVDAIFLRPQSESLCLFYEKLNMRRLMPPLLSSCNTALISPTAEHLFSVYSIHARNKLYIKRDLAYFNALITESSKCNAAILCSRDTYALCYYEGDKCEVAELCGSGPIFPPNAVMQQPIMIYCLSAELQAKLSHTPVLCLDSY